MLKLFHKTPETHPLKTGFNWININGRLARMICIYLAIEGNGFIGLYLGRMRKNNKYWIDFTHSRKWRA